MALEGFGQRLRGLRKAAGLTQQELANLAGLTREGIAQLETGRRSPAWATVEALCRALHIGPDAFTSAGEGESDVACEPPTRVYAPPQRLESPAVRAYAPRPGFGEAAALNIFLVEDHDDVALLIRKILERVGHEVTRCGTAADALAALAQSSFDLILLDQFLPDMDGLDLIRQFVTQGVAAPVILVTGKGDENLAVRALHAGAIDYIVKDGALSFLGELPQRITGALRRHRDAVEKERLASQDALTGLLNRRALDELVRSELKRRAREPAPLAVGFVDVDHFKRINNEYGHVGGDRVLQRLAQVMASAAREGDSLGRFGGDEFLLLARETGAEAAAALAERLRAAVASAAIEYRAERVHVTVSVGFAVAEVGVPAEFDEMLRQAADALEEAKQSGRDRSVVRVIEPPVSGRPR